MHYFLNGKFTKTKPAEGAVFLQFDESWKALQYSDAKLSIESQKLALQFFEREWIFLKKIELRYEQEGPYSAKEIFEMLKGSSLSSESFIWKKGFIHWKKLKEVSAFAELFTGEILSANEEFVKTQSETADILENIIEMQRVVPKDDAKNFCNDEDAVLIKE